MVAVTVSISLPARRPVLAEVLPGTVTRSGITIVAGAALTALAAQVSLPVPGSPVPVTGQTFAVLLTAAALGPLRGLASQGLYLALGVVGLPVFAGAAHGPHVLFGASGGYLVGFLAAAAIVGAGARRGADRSPLRTLLLFALASVGHLPIGTAWLCLDTGMSERGDRRGRDAVPAGRRGQGAARGRAAARDVAAARARAGADTVTARRTADDRGRRAMSASGAEAAVDGLPGPQAPDLHTTAGKIADLERRRYRGGARGVGGGGGEAARQGEADRPGADRAAAGRGVVHRVRRAGPAPGARLRHRRRTAPTATGW